MNRLDASWIRLKVSCGWYLSKFLPLERLCRNVENIVSIDLSVISTAGRNLRSLTFVRDDNSVSGHCDTFSDGGGKRWGVIYFRGRSTPILIFPHQRGKRKLHSTFDPDFTRLKAEALFHPEKNSKPDTRNCISLRARHLMR